MTAINEKLLDNRLLSISNKYDALVAMAEKVRRMSGPCGSCGEDETYVSFNLEKMDTTWYPNKRGTRMEKVPLVICCHVCGAERYIRNNPNA